MPKRLTTARPPEIDRLERCSLFGGRSDIWYTGDVSTWHSASHLRLPDYKKAIHSIKTSAIYRVDISSMYPYIFSQYETPGLCIYHETKHANEELRFAVKSDYIICAAVRINTNIPEYPVRIHAHDQVKNVVDGKRFSQVVRKVCDSVEYGIGEFDTVLIGPELTRAFDDGHIVRCYEYSVYLKSNEFMEYMTFLIGQRYINRKLGNVHLEKMYKMIANSFGGKLAQRNAGWSNAPDDTAVKYQWGEWYTYDFDTGVGNKFRSISGYPQIWVKERYNPRGRPAVWSFVCAVGRYIMRSIREIMPEHSILQQDTDGMYVTHDGVDALNAYGLLDDTGPGKLRIVSEHRHVRFYDARHYVCDGKAIMSGLTAGFKVTDGEHFLDTKEYSIGHGKLDFGPTSITTQMRRVSLDCEMTPHRIGVDGWTVPYRVNNKSGWQPYGVDPLGVLFRSHS